MEPSAMEIARQRAAEGKLLHLSDETPMYQPIYYRRRELRLPIIVVAESLGISGSQLSRVERSLVMPGLDLIQKAGEFFRCDPFSLFDLTLIQETRERRSGK